MPPPMVPAPITAARATAWIGVPRGTSGTLAASRSAKNRWRSARDSIETTQSANSARSRAEPSANGRCIAASIPSIAASGAGSRDLSVPRAAVTAARPAAVSSGRSRVRRRSPAAARARANAIAPARRSPSTMWSRMPASLARGARSGLPSVHISIASAAPASRGSRWVPPAPGMMPSRTSGCPTLASAVATR